MRKLVALCAAAVCAAAGSVAMGVDKLPAIQTVEITGAHLAVNGQPFFPLMSWAQNKRSYPMLHSLGFNTHASGDADAAAAAESGDYVVTSYKKDQSDIDRVLAWIHGDEPDMPVKKTKKPRTEPDALVAKYQQIKAADPSRPVFVTFTSSFMKEHGDYAEDVRSQMYPGYMKAADVVGFDYYPIYGSGYAGRLNYVGQGVAELRALAGPKKPVYAWIETSKGSQWMTYEKQPDVLPMHTRNEVWQAIINGASAIGYFTHVWKPAFKEFGPTQEMQRELLRLNSQVTRLAPAILAEPAKEAITMKLGEGLECQCKATAYKGDTYLFALNRDLGVNAETAKQFDPIKPHGGAATFTAPGLKMGTQIEVVDEGRKITSRQGGFTDDFAPLAEHIYKWAEPGHP